MPLQPGATLDNGKYLIKAAIGRGGFGYVYRALEQLTGEIVAIKELVPGLVGEPHVVQRFIQEARATLRLTHPHIARTYNIFQDGDTYYLVMEYLPGGSLADRLRRGPLAAEEAARVVADLCTALDYAHSRGVVHCDLKPANVLFDQEGAVRLADFGIAHVSEQLMTRHVSTGSGTTMGTVRYMAPEQLEGVRDDPRVDVYALGAMLYEMLAGRPYLDFETETTPAAQMRNIQRIQIESPRPLAAANPAVPGWLAHVVERALRKTPSERYRTALALRQALQKPEAVAAGAPVPGAEMPPTLVVPPPTPPALAPSKGRRQPVWPWILLGGLLLAVVVVFVVAGVLLLGDDGQEPTAVVGATVQPTAPALAVAVSPTAVLSPVPTATLVPSPLPATPTPSNEQRERAMLERVEWRSGNGPPLIAYYAENPPLLDGVLNDWTGREYAVRHVVHGRENWQGAADLEGVVMVAWDDLSLYLGLRIRDDRHVQAFGGPELYRGDDLELQVDIELLGDYDHRELSGDDVQVGLAVRDLAGGQYEAYRWRPSFLEGPLNADAAVQPTPGGYVLEVAVPWQALNLSPGLERPYGFCLSLADVDTPGVEKQESMVSTCPNREWGDPTTWGTLILVNW